MSAGMRLILGCTLFFNLSVHAFSTATQEQMDQWGISLTAGGTHTCALQAGEVRCWGDGEFQQTLVPSLIFPRLVAAGIRFTCAVDKGGVKCWGQNQKGVLTPPTFSHPTALSVGFSHACVIDEGTVKCWGTNEFKELEPPTVEKPKTLASGLYHSCVLTEEGNVKCWGDSRFKQLEVPKLNQPYLLEAGNYHTCAADADGIQCWGNNSQGQLTGIPPKFRAVGLSAGSGHTCAWNEQEVRCWGVTLHNVTTTSTRPVKLLAAGGDFKTQAHNCALVDTSITCWGTNEKGQFNAPPILSFLLKTPEGKPVFSNEKLLEEFESQLLRLSNVTYFYKKEFLIRSARDISHLPLSESDKPKTTYYNALARLYLAKILVIFLEDTNSPLVQEELLPALRQTNESFRVAYELEQLENIPLRSPVFQIAVRTALNAASACRDYAGEESIRNELEELIQELVLLAAKPQEAAFPDPADVRRVYDVLKSHQKLFKTLSTQSRVRGLGLILTATLDFFEGQ